MLAVAVRPAAAQARIDAGRSGNEQPRLWAIEIGTHAKKFASATYLARMKHAGINAVVVDPQRLTLKELRATVMSAERARLWVVEVVPPAGARPTRSVKAVRATCGALRPGQILCAVSVSLSAATAPSSSGSAGPMVAVRLASPAQVARLGGLPSSGVQILALVKLGAHRYATAEWRRAIAVAAATKSLSLGVTPTGASKTLSPYLNQLAKPPTPPASFAVAGSTASTVSVGWTAVDGATEYDLATNGQFAGKTATTSFTVGGLACNTAYKLAVTAKNTGGKTSKPSTLTTSTAPCSDTTPPSAPAGLTETSSTPTSATLAWASSTDAVGVTGYGVFVDGASVGTTASTTYNISGLACGSTHTVAVDAFDSAGNHSTRTAISASTSACPDTTPPIVSVTAPTAGATVSGTVLVTASASDNVAVSSVEFWLDGAKVATDTSAPYTYSWDTTQVPGGAHTILVKAVDTSNNSASTTDGVTVSNSPCVASSATWQNTPMVSPNGTFDVSFDATPSAGNIDALTGLSAAPALAYTDLAVIARFNSTGTIDAINGGGYAAANPVSYAGGSTYQFRAVVNVPNHAYSLYVKPPGTPETPVALNYAFRTGQTGVTALTDWAVTAGTGSHQTCGLAVSNPSDTTAPTAPTALAKTSSTQTSVSVSWAASSDDVGVAGYTVYVNGTASSATAGTSRTVSGLSCSSTYTIGVDAYDADGNHSAPTSTTMSTSACPDTTPPSTPTTLNQSGSTATSVTVSWTASTDNVGVTGYTLYVNGAQVGTTTGTTATAAGLACGTAYSVAVDAVDAAGNHSTKAPISASTAACPDTTPPATPTGLATSAVGQTSITLSWTASSTSYRLYVGGSQVGTSSTTSYVFNGLSCGTSYTLGVAAVDAAGNVSGTATISATTAACSSGSQFAGTFDCYDASTCPASELPTPPACTYNGGNPIAAATLQTALNAAGGGAVICLNSGSTGNISLSSKNYGSEVTVRPASGASVTVGTVTLSAVRFLHFSGNGGGGSELTMDETHVNGLSTNLTWNYMRFTGCMYFAPTMSGASAVLVDHTRHDNIGNSPGHCTNGEGRIHSDYDGSSNWLTVSNSHFGGQNAPYCSDGIQAGGDGMHIGPGNEFTGITQSACGYPASDPTHADPIQFYGGSNTLVTGNYFHDNGDGSGGCMCWGNNPVNETITNNVFASTGGNQASITGGDSSGSGAANWLIAHNVFYKHVTLNNDGQGAPPLSGNNVRDNVWIVGPDTGVTDGGGSVSYSYNLNCTKAGADCSGAGNIIGTPVFVASPAAGYYHYQLASSSPGYHAASDGKSMGITP